MEVIFIMPSHYPLIDAHTHLGSDSERSERQKKQILSLVCASTPPEAEALLKTAKPYLLPTAGLHPVAGGIIFRK